MFTLIILISLLSFVYIGGKWIRTRGKKSFKSQRGIKKSVKSQKCGFRRLISVRCLHSCRGPGEVTNTGARWHTCTSTPCPRVQGTLFFAAGHGEFVTCPMSIWTFFKKKFLTFVLFFFSYCPYSFLIFNLFSFFFLFLYSSLLFFSPFS